MISCAKIFRKILYWTWLGKKISTAYLFIALVASAVPAVARPEPDLPCATPDQERNIAFSVSHGSKMSLDVSPDGQRVVFDLLGDIYVVSIYGGRARAITSGPDWDKRPVWSPDGMELAFISDRSGSDAVYVVRVDGDHGVVPRLVASRSPRKHSIEDELQIVEWMPGGRRLYVDGDIVDFVGGSRRSMHELVGAGGGTAQLSGNAIYYFARDKRPSSSSHEVIGDHEDRYAVWRLNGDDLKTEPQEERLPAMSVRDAPVVTPDGRWIIFKDAIPVDRVAAPVTIPHVLDKRVDVLRAYDRRSRRVSTLLGPGMSVGWRSNGGRAGFAEGMRISVTPDSQHVVVPYAGQIHKINIESGQDEVVPFRVDFQQCLASIVRNKVQVSDEPLQVKSMRAITASPDGTALVFSALRRLYIQDGPSRAARWLAPQVEGQFDPAFSPDGEWIAYVSWRDDGVGHVWRVRRHGGEPERITKTPGYYRFPAWSPMGDVLAFSASHKGSENYGSATPTRRMFGHIAYVRTSGEGEPSATLRQLEAKVDMSQPIRFDMTGSRITYATAAATGSSRGSQVQSIDLNGSAEHIRVLDRFIPSAWRVSALLSLELRAAAIIKYGNLYVVRCKSLDQKSALPDRVDGDGCTEVKVTHEGANDPRWLPSSDVLEWSFSNKYYRASLKDIFAPRLPESGRQGNEEDWFVRRVDLSVPRTRATGDVALTGAKIITMKGNEIIHNGTILVRNGRIAAVGPAKEVAIPKNAHVILAEGKIIMPGLVDAHAHLTELPEGLLPRNFWESLIYLSFGVTTARDPSFMGDHSFSYAELVESGQSVGPRMFGSVALVNENFKIDSYRDALDITSRYKMLGASFMKYHTGWNREKRRWIIDAAREHGLNAVSHAPAVNYISGTLDLSTISDGSTSSEHVFTLDADMYEDAIRFITASGVSVDFASLASYGGYSPVYLPRHRASDQRMQRFFERPTPDVKKRLSVAFAHEQRLADLVPETDANARFISKLAEVGAKVMIGSHGDNDGVGMHWEMWAHAEGGMSNHEVLRAATLGSAYGLGADADIGSLEVGKVADLLVLGADPLSDITNSMSIDLVMQSGVLRESMTLDEIWPNQEALPPWRMSDYEPSASYLTGDRVH